eukprot:491141_1
MEELSKKISMHYIRTRPTEELQLKKDKLCEYITKCVQYVQAKDPGEKYKKVAWTVFKVGSESEGTSLRDSDIDLSVYTNYQKSRRETEKLLYRLYKIVRKNDSLSVKLMLNTQFPIIKIYEINYKIYVNLSLSGQGWYSR